MSLATERFIKSYPALMATAIWQDDGLFKLYHYCLYKASRNVYKWRGCVLQPGDMIFSFRNAANELGWSLSKLQRKLDMLSHTGFVSISSSSVGTRIRVKGLANSDLLQYQDSANDDLSQIPYSAVGCVPIMSTPCTDNEYTLVPKTSTGCTQNEHTPVPITSTPCTDNEHTLVPKTSTGCTQNEHTSVPKMSTNLEGNQEDIPRYPVRQVDVSKFDQLWLAYPVDRRTSRNEAQKHYRDALIHGATHEAIMTALEAIKGTVDWKKESGRYIPGIAKWLEKETWRDFMPPVVEESEIWTSR